MAKDKKSNPVTTRKRDGKGPAKAGNTAAELREKLSPQLEIDLKTAKKDLLELQKSLKANELANPHAVKKMRREIARIKTILAEKARSEKLKAGSKVDSDELKDKKELK